MRVLVTGGCGFIGSHVVDHLRDAGHEVVVFDVAARSHRPDVEVITGNILDPLVLEQAVQGCQFVFHLAAIPDVNTAFADPVACVEVNTLGTALVLEAARRHGVARVVLASTVWVYGAASAEEVDETSCFEPTGAGHVYTTSKIAAELLCQDFWRLYKQPFTILRYGIPYGPRMRRELVIPRFIDQALNGEVLTIAGDGSQHRNFVYVEDLARAHVLAMAAVAENQIYNLEGAERVTVLAIAQTLQRLLPQRLRIEFVPARVGDYGGKAVSAEKAWRDLGWRPEISFEEGLRRTLLWYQEAVWQEATGQVVKMAR